MTRKNETPALLISLLITGSLVGAGVWWLTQKSGVNLSQSEQAPPVPTTSPEVSSPVAGKADWSEVQNVPAGIYNYGGSTSWAPIRLSVDGVLQAARPEFRLRYINPTGNAPSSASGIRMLLDGQIQFAQSSRPISQQEQQEATQKGFSLKEIPVAIDGIAIAVHPSQSAPGLTIEQLRSIYLGQVTSWKQVGGQDLPIVAFSRSDIAGNTFSDQVLKGQPLSSTVQIVGTTTEGLQKVGSTPGGIYFASAPEVVPQCTVKTMPIGTSDKFVPPYAGSLAACPTRNQLNIAAFQNGTYPLTRNLSVIVKQNNGQEQRAGEAYANLLLTTPAQEAIAKAGFVRVR
jgi:phosphate transport system substrate-binding protein